MQGDVLEECDVSFVSEADQPVTDLADASALRPANCLLNILSKRRSSRRFHVKTPVSGLCCAIGRGNTGGWLPVNPTWHKTKRSHVCANLSCCTVFLPRSAAQRYFYHIHNNNENTGQIAHSAHARNATPSAKMAISSGFGMMLSLFSVAGLPRPPCLIHHSPPVGRAISVCRRKRRQIAICGRFPIPCGAFCWHCL